MQIHLINNDGYTLFITMLKSLKVWCHALYLSDQYANNHD